MNTNLVQRIHSATASLGGCHEAKTMRTALLALTILLVPSMVVAQNSPPIADAGVDQSIFIGDSTVLQGSATDADGDLIISWQWFIVSKPLGSAPLFAPTTSQNPSFLPDMLGDYVFAMIANDGDSGFGLPAYLTVSVVTNQPPIAVALADVTTGTAPLTVQFDGTQSYDPENLPFGIRWNFGDGSTTSPEISPAHLYPFPGTYTADVTIVDDAGQSDVDTILITVLPATNNPPVASPTATPTSGAAPLLVQFAGNGSDADGDPVSYSWDFGDPTSANNTGTLATASHTYAQAGTYVTWLTVSDGTDDASYSMTIVVDSASFMSVKSAQIKFKKKGHTQAKVQVKADISAISPAGDDFIIMTLDGEELFAAPFSDFILAGHDHEDDDVDEEGEDDDNNPGKYKLHEKHLKVELDIFKGRIEVKGKKIDLSSMDTANGVDIELHIGANVAVENITMESSDKKLRFKRDDDE